jgi:hypothetical protein
MAIALALAVLCVLAWLASRWAGARVLAGAGIKFDASHRRDLFVPSWDPDHAAWAASVVLVAALLVAWEEVLGLTLIVLGVVAWSSVGLVRDLRQRWAQTRGVTSASGLVGEGTS